MPAVRTQNTTRAHRANPISTARRGNPKAKSKSCKPIFARATMSIAGDFTAFRSSWTHEKMALWITNHAGTYVPQVTSETTHLICTIDEFKAKSQQVREAWKLGSRCHIVTADWLEDCLDGKVRLRSVRDYKLSRVLKRIKKGKKAQEEYKNRFEEGVKAGESFAGNSKPTLCPRSWKSAYLQQDGLYRICYDDTAFEYKVVLTRINMIKGFVEKHTIYLFESVVKPPLFMCAAKFSRPCRETIYYDEKTKTGNTAIPKLFRDAFKDFTDIFRNKTGVDWDERLEGKNIEGKFVYTPPKLGRPVGLLPYGYVRPEEREVEGENGDDGLVYDTDSEADETEVPTPGTLVHAGGNNGSTSSSGDSDW